MGKKTKKSMPKQTNKQIQASNQTSKQYELVITLKSDFVQAYKKYIDMKNKDA